MMRVDAGMPSRLRGFGLISQSMFPTAWTSYPWGSKERRHTDE
ncbi:hypothetical protein CES85_4482 [Ochrobactrum quorumnocens]|uniref:Uncharacterized protein n=1 Tax=Ochrobactrum quorumnocens TaxID=271865 RepID=A0A248UBI6_9HYPH|nr:hypothetical protein CES85_4482 [[Ochrobactrum] quorumnocens]